MITTKLRRNSKALSPIFATLILIAIAVIAGIVVYMFTSGYVSTMTGTTAAGQEKVAVTGVDPAKSLVYAQNTGSQTVTIVQALVKDTSGNVVGTPDNTGGDINAGNVQSISFLTTGLNSGSSYTVTLISSKGGNFVSPSFICP